MSDSPLRNRLLVIAAAVLFSTGGAAIKAVSVGAWQIASFRSGIAALFLLAVIPAPERRFRWRMLPVAACYAATLICFVLANRLTTAANTIFLQSTAPLYMLLLGPVLLREPIRRRDLLFVAVVIGGIACIFLGSPGAGVTAPDPRRGNLFAVASGMTYAWMLVGLRWLSRKGAAGGANSTIVLGNFIACLAALPMALPVSHFALRDLAILLFLGTVQIGVAYLCLTVGIRQVPAVQAATLLMVEPALNPLWTWLVHGEAPGAWGVAGGVLILSGALSNTWRAASRQAS